MTLVSVKRASFVLILLFLLGGCTAPQIHSSGKVQNNGLVEGDLQASGMAFITPSTITGQEEDKQTVALIFSDVLHQIKPKMLSVTLPQTLTAINRAGFTGEYQKMFENYRETGIFEKSTLNRISQITGARYLAQLKLEGFRQDSTDRWGILGLRVLETKSADVRIFLQIWDGKDGAIVWEGTEELNSSHESFSENNIPFKNAVEEAARNLLTQLP